MRAPLDPPRLLLPLQPPLAAPAPLHTMHNSFLLLSCICCQAPDACCPTAPQAWLRWLGGLTWVAGGEVLLLRGGAGASKSSSEPTGTAATLLLMSCRRLSAERRGLEAAAPAAPSFGFFSCRSGQMAAVRASWGGRAIIPGEGRDSQDTELRSRRSHNQGPAYSGHRACCNWPRPPAARLHSRPPLPAHLAGPTQVVAQVCPRRKGEQEVQGIKDAVDGCLQQGQESGATNRREESRTRQHGGAVRRGQRAPAVTGAMGVQESGETCAKLPPMAGSLADCLGGGRLPDCPTCPCASVCWR